MSRKIRPGDYVQIENGAQGYIRDINFRHTTIRELANNLVVVPNAKMASAVNRNYSLPEQEVAVLVDVCVSYANDLTHVERQTLDVARETLREVSGGVAEFEPEVRYHTFADRGCALPPFCARRRSLISSCLSMSSLSGCTGAMATKASS